MSQVAAPPEVIEPAPEEAAPALPRGSLRAFSWMLTQTLATRLVMFVGQVILARLLTPAEYGVIGLAYSVQAFALLLQNKGVGNILVAKQTEFGRLANPAFWFSLAIGSVL